MIFHRNKLMMRCNFNDLDQKLKKNKKELKKTLKNIEIGNNVNYKNNLN